MRTKSLMFLTGMCLSVLAGCQNAPKTAPVVTPTYSIIESNEQDAENITNKAIAEIKCKVT